MGELTTSTLTLGHRLAYGVGHVQNDLFAAMWFSYLLLYLQFVMKIPVTSAGLIFLIGQFCDGIITPLIAYESDRLNWKWYGRRKTTHLIGSVIISLTFPFVFTQCAGCENASYWSLIAYFIPLVCIFQSGWAAVQVSHLSLIPEMTSDPKERDELNIIRYGFDILTDTSVYVITYLVLSYNVGEDIMEIGPESADLFQNIAWILVAVGIFFTGVFHIYTPEKKGTVTRPDSPDCSPLPPSMIWKDWFKIASFYQIAILFAISRVITNLLQAFVPLYLQEGIRAPPNMIAIIPLVINLSGFISSMLVKPVLMFVSKRTVFMISSAIIFTGCIWLAMDEPDQIRSGNIYVIAVLSGVGGSTMLVLALSFAADLIGENTDSGGFVYGCMAFTEKIVNGIAILAFQAGRGICAECTDYYKEVLCYGVSFFVMVNLATVLCLGGSKNLGVKKSLLWDEKDEDDSSNLLANAEKRIKYGSLHKGFQLLSSAHIKGGKL